MSSFQSCGCLRDKIAHHLDAFGQVEIGNLDTVRTHKINGAWKSSAFANDNFSDPELHYGAGAKIAGHQSGVERGVAKTAEPTSTPQAIDFGMRHRIVVLHAAIVAGGNDLAIARQNRTDRDSTFAPAFSCLRNGGLHEWILFLAAHNAVAAPLCRGALFRWRPGDTAPWLHFKAI